MYLSNNAWEVGGVVLSRTCCLCCSDILSFKQIKYTKTSVKINGHRAEN
jgi:hypothetical protein